MNVEEELISGMLCAIFIPLLVPELDLWSKEQFKGKIFQKRTDSNIPNLIVPHWKITSFRNFREILSFNRRILKFTKICEKKNICELYNLANGKKGIFLICSSMLLPAAVYIRKTVFHLILYKNAFFICLHKQSSSMHPINMY